MSVLASFKMNPLFLAELEVAAVPILAAHAEAAAKEAVRILGDEKSTGAAARSVRADGPMLIMADPFAHLIEFGSANNEPIAPLRRAVESTGATWVDGDDD